MFPEVPIEHPLGSGDAEGNCYHILVIFLENRANRDLLGELRAKQVMASGPRTTTPGSTGP